MWHFELSAEHPWAYSLACGAKPKVVEESHFLLFSFKWCPTPASETVTKMPLPVLYNPTANRQREESRVGT